jgi:hypothetical protein
MTSKASQSRCCGPLDLSQIGACMHCVVLAAALTAAFWTGFVLVTKNYDLPWISIALAVFSSLFSLMLAAHAIAFFAKRKSK